MSRNLLLVSSSKCHPSGYLDHCATQAAELFTNVSEIVFVPYARPGGTSHDAYTTVARDRFASLGIAVRGLHEFDSPVAAIEESHGLFIGGGNTFVLLKQLYDDGIVEVVRRRLNEGLPYLGTSAGSNLAGLTIGSSNDMPIVHPPSFDAFAVVPFNINPHYPRAAADPTHMGETRVDRIAEFHIFNPQPVVSVCEDGMLRVVDNQMTLMGESEGYVFRAGKDRESVDAGANLSQLLNSEPV